MQRAGGGTAVWGVCRFGLVKGQCLWEGSSCVRELGSPSQRPHVAGESWSLGELTGVLSCRERERPDTTH